MIYLQNDYISILKDEFEKRVSSNPCFSLRAFARYLGIPVASLSDALNRKRGISLKTAKKISFKIYDKEEERNYFCDLVIVKGGKSKIKRELAQKRISAVTKNHRGKSYNKLHLDSMKIVSRWYHFAILELTYICNFKSEIRWIAGRLGISNFETKEAIERLFKLKLLKKEDNRYIDANNYLATYSNVPSREIRNFHKQIIDKAKNAIDDQILEERELSSNIMAINKKDIPKAKEMLKEFRRRFSCEMEKNATKDSVYALSTQFFSLINGDKR